MTKTIRNMCLAFLAISLCGCALMGQWQKMDAKKKALWMMRAFNAEYVDVMQQAQMYQIMPETARKVLRWRHMLLKEVYPLIAEYVTAVHEKREPDLKLEDRIMSLMNRLMAAKQADIDENAPPEPKQPEPAVEEPTEATEA